VQLSTDENQPPAAHYDIGRRLMPLREAWVLVSFPLEGVDE
jgi:aromatic ring-opening dioxygenase catalytic subunit (LigB family)